MTDISRLRTFVSGMTELAGQSDGDEEAMIGGAQPLLAELISKDDWLPEAYAVEGETYRQYLLHCDPLQRFSVVSFIWGPGEVTPVHDHTVWGLIGVLRGAETGQSFELAEGGGPMIAGEPELLQPGQIDVVSPTRGDIHVVTNAIEDRASISIHVYGANIGAVSRHVFDRDTSAPKEFISGYTNDAVPNLWDLSAR
jgi:predicted metal-dependent enzyme (double-stranded beta helix superfamily)